MRYRRFGRTGVHVSSLCLGAMMFGQWGNPDHDESIAVIHAALDAGINFIDTADVYSAGESEEIVAKAIVGRRDDIVLATKFFAPMGADRNMAGGSRRWIMRACEDSLRRLGTDHLDLYQVHRPDPNVDIDETLGALSDLVHQGKVRYLGSSTWPASAIVEAQWVAERRNRQRFVCEQPPYSILVRGVEVDVLPTCLQHDMAVIPWSPLAGGWLSGKWRVGGERFTTHRANRVPARYDLDEPGNQQKLEAADALGRLADEAGLPLVHLAVAWVLRNPAVTSAIIGPRTMEQLTTQLGAADVDLEPDVLDRIDEIVPPGTNFTWADAGYSPPMITDSRATPPVTVRGTAQRAVASVLARGGVEVRRLGAPVREPVPIPEGASDAVNDAAPDAPDPRTVDYFAQARLIDERHATQTTDDVEALRRKYAVPVFGTVRVWDLVERLALCIDPSDCALFCTSQLTHVLQMLDAMDRDGIDDPELLLAVLVHDLGKLLLVAGEDPANVVCMNSPIGEPTPGVGLDQCTFQWNHDEFGWSRLRDHVPDGVAWLVRYHSMDADAVAPLMDARDREYRARYFDVFTRYDHGTKTPFHLPRVQLESYREIVEDAFPEPIPF